MANRQRQVAFEQASAMQRRQFSHEVAVLTCPHNFVMDQNPPEGSRPWEWLVCTLCGAKKSRFVRPDGSELT
jgi:hypothetical protein